MSQCSQTVHRSVVWDCTNAVHFHSRLLSYRLVPVQSWNTCRRHSSSVSSSGFPLHPRSAAGRCQSTECGTWLLKTPSLCYQHHRAGKHNIFFKPLRNIRHLVQQYILQVQSPRTLCSWYAHIQLMARSQSGICADNAHETLRGTGTQVNFF